MTLKSRIEALEQRSREDEPLAPALIFWRHLETLEQAKKRYEQQHGFPLADGAKIIEMIACDMSEEGGGREAYRRRT